MTDDVTTLHPEYAEWSPRWEQIDDAIAGSEKVKSKRSTYLRPLSGMLFSGDSLNSNFDTLQNYDLYLERARWYAAPTRALVSWLGLVSRRAITLNVDDKLADLVETDINGQGVGVSQVMLQLIDGMLRYSRPLLLVDYTKDVNDPNSKRGYIDYISAKNVVNWREKNGEFTLLVIKRDFQVPDSDNEFKTLTRCSYAVYRLEDVGVTYQRYDEQVTQYQKVELVPGEKINLTILNKPMESIPARFINVSDDPFRIEIPSIDPICDFAYHYYKVSADRSWALHHIALPTPYFTSVNRNQLPSGLGPSIMIALPQGATCGMLTYTGQGLNELTIEMDNIKAEIADYGARILESRARAQEAQATVEMKMNTDGASLSMVVTAASRGMTWALKLLHELNGFDSEDANLEMDTNFIKTKITGPDLTALVNAYLQGGIPLEVLYDNLKEGQVVDDDATFEEFEQQLMEGKALQAEMVNQLSGVIPDQGQQQPQDQGQGNIPPNKTGNGKQQIQKS